MAKKKRGSRKRASAKSLETRLGDTEESVGNSSSEVETHADVELKRWRSRLVPYFTAVVTAALVMIGICLWMMFTVVRDPPNYSTSTTDVVALATLFHVGLGMIIGLASITFGVVMSWVGIEAPFVAEARPGVTSPAFRVASVGPGIALLIGGMAIIYSSLHLPIEIDPHGRGGIVINDGGGSGGQEFEAEFETLPGSGRVGRGPNRLDQSE